MNKYAIFAGLGDFYSQSANGFDQLLYSQTNINQLMSRLSQSGWVNGFPMKDPTATKGNIVTKLTTQINAAQDGDWLLFYFVGHGAKYPMPGTAPDKTFCVTYAPDLTATSWPPLSTFFSEDDYLNIVNLFEQKIPNGHLIVILDCCYAFGLLNAFDVQKDFQTIIASSAANAPTYYAATSYFFQAFSQAWNSKFSDLASNINVAAAAVQSNLQSVINIATKYKDQTL